MSEQDCQRFLDFAHKRLHLQKEIDVQAKMPETEDQIARLLQLHNEMLAVVREQREYEISMAPQRSAEEAERLAREAAAQLRQEQARREQAEKELERLQLQFLSGRDRLRQFMDAHGQHISDGHTLLMFPDGATCKPANGEFLEPPTDPVQLAIARRRYLREQIARFEAQLKSDLEWNRLAAANALRFRNLPPVGQDILDSMLKGKERLDELKQQEAELTKQIGDGPKVFDPVRDSLPFDKLIQTERFKQEMIASDLAHLIV